MARSFLDTNVVVYLFDNDAIAKQTKAKELFETESAAGRLVLSTQVLQEFYVTVTRKLAQPLPAETAERALVDLAKLPVVGTDAALVRAAVARSRSLGFSLWDALIVEAASAGGAETLLTEDLQHGQVIDDVRIENPFAA